MPVNNHANPTIESFSFEEVEALVDRDDVERDELECDIVEYMNRFFAIVMGTTPIYVEKTIRHRKPVSSSKNPSESAQGTSVV